MSFLLGAYNQIKELWSNQGETLQDDIGSGVSSGGGSSPHRDSHSGSSIIAGSEQQSTESENRPQHHEALDSGQTCGKDEDDIHDIDGTFFENKQVQGQSTSPEDNARQTSYIDLKTKYFGEEEIPRPHTLDLSNYSPIGVGRLSSIKPMSSLVSGYRWDPNRFASQYNVSNSRSNLKKVQSGYLHLPREMSMKEREKQLNHLSLKLILGKISQLGRSETALIFWKKEEVFKGEALLQKSLFKNVEPKMHIEFRKLRSKLYSTGFLEMESGGSRYVKKFLHFVLNSSTQQTVYRALTEAYYQQSVLIPIVKSDSLADNCSDIVHAVNEYSKSCDQTTVTIWTDEDFLYEALDMCVQRLEEDQNEDYDTCSDTSDSVCSLDDVKETFSYVSINYHCRYYLNKKPVLISEHDSSEILRFRGEECMKLRYVIGTDLEQERLKLKIKNSGGTNLEFRFIDGKDQIYVESSCTLQGDTELDLWKKNVKSTLKAHIYEIGAYCVFTQKDIYKDVLDKLQKLRGVQQRQIITLTESDDHRIWIVGHPTSANRALSRAQTIIAEIKKARERITITLKFSKGQMDILKGSEFYQSVLRMYSRLDIVLEENGALVITGTVVETEKVKGQIQTWMKRLVTFDIQPKKRTIWCLLRNPEIQQYVIDSYLKNQVQCALDIREPENIISLCVEHADHINAENINELFQKFIVHFAYRDPNIEKLMKLKWWGRKRKELLEKYPGKLCIHSEIETGSMIINCTDDVKDKVDGIIVDALKCLDFQKKFGVSGEIVKYLRKCRIDEISQLQYKHDVDISYDSPVIKSSNGSIGIKGIQYEVEEAYKMLICIIDQVDSIKHLCTQPAAVSYLSKHERYIDSIKKKMNCNIKIEKTQRLNTTSDSPTWSFNGCSFSVLGQDSTDAVVVHPIERSSGRTRTEKQEKLKSFTKSLESLKTPLVSHLYPKWKENDEKGKLKSKLEISFKNLIHNQSQLGCRSIAFPIEQYNLWPLETLVETILFTVKHAKQENDTLQLNTIIVCKSERDYLMVFRKIETFMDTKILKGIKQRKHRPQTVVSDICFTITAQREDIKVIKGYIEDKCCRLQTRYEERNSRNPSSDSDSFAEISPTLKITPGKQLFGGLPVHGIKAGIAASGVRYRDEISDYVSDKLQRSRSMPGINLVKGWNLDDEANCGQGKCSGYDLRKRYNTTMYVSSLDDFSKDHAKSIGHITIAGGDGTIYCTGFRAGFDYVVSTYHSFKEILDLASRWSWQQIDHFWSSSIFIKFGFKRETERDSIVKCFFSPRICFFNPELDVIVLKLKAYGNPFPPPLHLSQHDHSLKKISFYGHPKGEPLLIDPGCHAQDLADDVIKKAMYFAQINFPNFPNGYYNVDNPTFSLYHCHFQVGASGAPGLIVEPNFNISVTCMLLRGYPYFFPDLSKDDQKKYPVEFMFEQCLPMTTFYKALKQKQPSLCDELFADTRPIENMEV